MAISPDSIRLIVDEPASGPVNMARDEALLNLVGSAQCPPILRFYTWNPSTISLGYFQRWQDFLDQPPPIRNLDVVRRTTGGGAILHDQEITYSIVLPADGPWLRPNASNLYRVAHQAIIAAVGHDARMAGCSGQSGACADAPASLSRSHRTGPFFCFARRSEFDVVIPDAHDQSGFAKLAGSAQRRTRSAVLQHGSLILTNRYPQQPSATWSANGGPRDAQQAIERLSAAFRQTLQAPLPLASFLPDYVDQSERLVGKYAGQDWTLGCPS